jgi:hypothetical protein
MRRERGERDEERDEGEREGEGDVAWQVVRETKGHPPTDGRVPLKGHGVAPRAYPSLPTSLPLVLPKREGSKG